MTRKVQGNCVLFRLNQMDKYLIKYRDPKQAREEIIRDFKKRFHVYDESDVSEFLQYYEFACDLHKQKRQRSVVSATRKKICKDCKVIFCGDCQEVRHYPYYDGCKRCRKVKKELPYETDYTLQDERCFFCDQFKKASRFYLVGNEEKLSPDGKCDRCYHCTTQEVEDQVEKVKLHDIPLNGYPTEVVIERKLYQSQKNQNVCKKIPLPGIQGTVQSKFTSRLIQHATTILLSVAYADKAVLAEWYGVAEQYLDKMKRGQIELVKKAKTFLRMDLDCGKIKIGLSKERFNDADRILVFLIERFPRNEKSPTEEMELAAIYLEDDWNCVEKYFADPSANQSECWKFDNDSDILPLLFDYVAAQQKMMPGMLALVTAMRIAIMEKESNATTEMRREFQTLYSATMLIYRENDFDEKGLRKLIASTEKISYLIPEQLKNSLLAEYTGMLIYYLYTQLHLFRTHSTISQFGVDFVNAGSKTVRSILDSDAAQQSYAISRTLSLYSENMMMKNRSLEELFEDLLFFNPAVVPYTSEGDTLRPCFLDNGDIDASEIRSIGIRITCVEEYLRTTQLIEAEGMCCGGCMKMTGEAKGEQCCDKRCRELQY